jgi:hypothetical protein
MAGNALNGVLENRANEIRSQLTLRSRKPGAARNPEQRKNLDRLFIAINDVLQLPEPVDRAQVDRLKALRRRLADTDPSAQTADSLGVILETVDEELAILGTAEYIGAQLVFEETRDGEPTNEWKSLWQGTDRAVIIEKVSAGVASPDQLACARAKLWIWCRSRHERFVLDRSRDAARGRSLRVLAPMIALLTALVIYAVELTTADATWREGLLVALAGGLGATLSRAYQVRDEVPRLEKLRTFGAGFVLQAALGAAAGVVSWIILFTGLVDIGASDTKWAIRAAVAFAAGFSEPFFLKTVQGLAGLQSKRES